MVFRFMLPTNHQSLAQAAFWRKFANLVKSGCVSAESKTTGPISRRAGIFKNSPVQKAGIRKSKTGRWRAAALILLNLFMIVHIIQWRLMGKTISPLEPSERKQKLQKGVFKPGFIFFSLSILAALCFGRLVCGGGCYT